MAEALEMFADGVLIVRNESQRAQTKFPTLEHLTLEFTSTKQNTLSDMHFSSRPNQRLPSVRTELTS
jgi:hypothetical protein